MYDLFCRSALKTLDMHESNLVSFDNILSMRTQFSVRKSLILDLNLLKYNQRGKLNELQLKL